MSGLRLSLYEGSPGQEGLELPKSHALFVYAPRGEVTVETADGSKELEADEGTFVVPGSHLAGPGLVFVFELAMHSAPFMTALPIHRSQRLKPAFGPPFLVRGDRIESEPGAATPRHGHRGPGIRRLIYGCILGEIGDGVERIEAGHSWFETGHDMVVGTNVGGTNAAFVRVMVLPAELEGGKSSFMPADEVEAAKPRSVKPRLYGEVMVEG